MWWTPTTTSERKCLRRSDLQSIAIARTARLRLGLSSLHQAVFLHYIPLKSPTPEGLVYLPLPTQKEIKELLDYDPDTGALTWKISRGGAVAGAQAGTPKESGRRHVELNGVRYYAARLIWVLVYGSEPEGMVDHRDRDPSNDKLKNLRDVPVLRNNWNRSANTNSKCPLKGVSWNSRRQKWRAQIRHDGRKLDLGNFDTPEEAYEVYTAKAKELRGVFHAD